MFKYVAPISSARSRGMGRFVRRSALYRSSATVNDETTRNVGVVVTPGRADAGSPPGTMSGDHDWPEIRARSGPTSAVDGEICHTEGDGPGHRVVKPAPFPRRRVMASSPCGEWVAVEACAPGTIRVFRGVPAETADGTTKHVPITDRHGRELTLDTRPETRPEARVLALEVVASHDPHDVSLKKKGRPEDGATVFAMTPDELRAFAIRRRRTTSDETHEEHARFECVFRNVFPHDTTLGVDRGRLVGLASNAKPHARRVAVVASNVARFFALGDLIRGSRTHIPKQDGHLGFHPSSRDGPVVACAFLDSETEHRLRISNVHTGTASAHVAAIGFEREIRVVRFFDGFPDRIEVLRRVLVDAPGPVRSIAAHAGWIFASTERKIALTSFGDFAREPMNFAFARASAAGEKKKGASPDGSETAELGEARPDASVVPFLRARLDPDAETRKLRDMVRPFLPAELRGIEPATGASREAEPSDARATLQAFTFEACPEEKSGSEPLDGVAATFVVTASLPLAPSSGARPEICALQTKEGGTKIVVALADVGARNADAAVAIAELSRRAGDLEARLAFLGTAPLTRGRGESHSRTGDERVTRLEAFARTFIARADRTDCRCGRSDVRDESSVRDVALLTLLTSETAEKETARVAGANVFGGGARKKPARASASLATFRVALFPSCPADSFEKAFVSNANGVGDGALHRGSSGTTATPALGGFLKGNETRDARAEPAERAPKPPGKKKDAADLDRVLDAIRALDSAVHARFDRVEATLQIQERRLRRVEESLKK